MLGGAKQFSSPLATRHCAIAVSDNHEDIIN